MKKKLIFLCFVLVFITVPFFYISCKGDDSNVLPPLDNTDTTAPMITSMTTTCFYGSTVIINGTNFSLNKTDNIVKFGTTEATVTEASKTSLTVTTPDMGVTTTTDITVTKFGKVSNTKSITVDVDQNKIATYNWPTHMVKSGITYKTSEFDLFGETLRRIHILDFTLNEANTLGIGFSTTNASTVAMCNSYNAVAGINAGYFPMSGAVDKDPYIRIDGNTVQDGHLNVNPIFTNSALIIHNDVAMVRKFTTGDRNQNQIAAAIPVGQARNVIVCGPMLITSGVIENLDMSNNHNSSLTARTGLGVSADGKRVFMVVVDTGGSVRGINTLQLAKILQALGATNAMNFDGGGSSTMFVKGQGDNGRANLPNGGTTQRLVRSVIYVK